MFSRALAVSAVSGRRVNFAAGEAHHVVPKERLRAWGLYHLVWEPRNGIWIARVTEHERHHDGGPWKIPRSAIPQDAWEFARAIGGPALVVVETRYPMSPDSPKEDG